MPVFIVYFALLAVAFFFLIVRPQRRQLAARRALIQAVEVGDEIITAGGIYAVVLSIDDDTLQVEIAPGIQMKLARETKPVLGLDLQGGIEVRLQQVGKQRSGAVLDKAVDIIRNRVNGLGVAETEVKRDGDQIVVDLPGVKDRDKARNLVGKTAELRFRPVLGVGAGASVCKP